VSKVSCIICPHYRTFLLLRQKKSTKRKAIFSKGSAGKKGLYAVMAQRLSAGWRWFWLYEGMLLGLWTLPALERGLAFSRSSRPKKGHHNFGFFASILSFC
jgi:hypothetical protein